MKRLLIAIVCVSLLAVAVGGVSAQETQVTHQQVEDRVADMTKDDVQSILAKDISEVSELEYRAVVVFIDGNELDLTDSERVAYNNLRSHFLDSDLSEDDVLEQYENEEPEAELSAEEMADEFGYSDIVEILESDDVSQKEYRAVVLWSAENPYNANDGDPDLDSWIQSQAEQRDLSPEQILPQTESGGEEDQEQADSEDSDQQQGESDSSNEKEQTEQSESDVQNENEINTDRVLHEVGNGALTIHDVRTRGDTVEVDISTTRFQTITITLADGDRLTTETQTVGSGSRTLVVEDTSGVEDLYVGANREAVRVQHGSGLNLLPIIDSRLALAIGLVVVFSGLFVKARKRRRDWKNRVKRVK